MLPLIRYGNDHSIGVIGSRKGTSPLRSHGTGRDSLGTAIDWSDRNVGLRMEIPESEKPRRIPIEKCESNVIEHQI